MKKTKARKQCEVIKAFGPYVAGDIISPSNEWVGQLIDEGLVAVVGENKRTRKETKRKDAVVGAAP